MGIMSNLFPKTSNSTAFGLTSKGKKRAEETSGESDEIKILQMLEEHGESSIKEIARELRIDYREARKVLKSMIKRGLVKGKAEEVYE